MLKKILILNALFSLTNTIIMLSLRDIMAGFLFTPEFSLIGISASIILQLLAFGLFGFAAYVVFVAFNLSKYVMQVKIIIVADFLWVMSTILLLIFTHSIFSFNGMLFFAIVGLIVAGFAGLQMKFLK